MTDRRMNVAAVQRHLRQIALPEVGPDGQQRLANAVVAVAAHAAGDLTAETAARYLAAAGVGALRLIGDGALPADAARALAQSNPDVAVERAAWPADGTAWLDALAGVDLVVRAGFDDDLMGTPKGSPDPPATDSARQAELRPRDAMLRAAIRLGIPAVVARASDDKAELIAFRAHGPCPHVPLDIPTRAAGAAPSGAGDVVAGTLAAAESLLMLLAAGAGPDGAAAARPGGRARHLAVGLDGGEPRAQDIPWSPECFACGGAGTEMVLS